MSTVSEMDTQLSRWLGDPNGYTWTQTTERLPALNIAQRQVVMEILGMAATNKSVFGLLYGIQASSALTVPTTGCALSGLDSTPGPFLSDAGFIRAECTLDSVVRRCHRRSGEREGLEQNQYLSGDDEHPVIYFRNNKVYIDTDADEYDVTLTFDYIRDPKTLVISNPTGYQVSTCELGVGLHGIVVKAAKAQCHLMVGDMEAYAATRAEVSRELQLAARGSVTSVKDGVEPGQHLRGAANVT